MEAHLDKVADDIKREIKSDQAMLDMDMQHIGRYVDYINEQQPHLNLHYADSIETMLRQLENRSDASYTRFIVRDSVNRDHYFMEFRHPQNERPTGIIFNHAGFEEQALAELAICKIRIQLSELPGFEKGLLIQVDTFKQENKSDNVIFAAHSAWTALALARDREKMHAEAIGTHLLHTR